MKFANPNEEYRILNTKRINFNTKYFGQKSSPKKMSLMVHLVLSEFLMFKGCARKKHIQKLHAVDPLFLFSLSTFKCDFSSIFQGMKKLMFFHGQETKSIMS